MPLPAPKGYTTLPLIAASMGLSALTETALTDQILVEVEATIDRITRRPWGVATPITGEIHRLSAIGTKLYLTQYPIVSVQQIQVRTAIPNDQLHILNAVTDYEITNAASGLVSLSGAYSASDTYSSYDDMGGSANYNNAGTLLRAASSYGSFALVNYTPAVPIPYDICVAARLIAAHWLEYSVFPERYGVSSERVGAVAQTYQQGIMRDIPTEAWSILSGPHGYRQVLL